MNIYVPAVLDRTVALKRLQWWGEAGEVARTRLHSLMNRSRVYFVGTGSYVFLSRRNKNCLFFFKVDWLPVIFSNSLGRDWKKINQGLQRVPLQLKGGSEDPGLCDPVQAAPLASGTSGTPESLASLGSVVALLQPSNHYPNNLFFLWPLLLLSSLRTVLTPPYNSGVRAMLLL